MIKHVWAVYFSPSGGTAKISETIARAAAKTLNIENIDIYDWTLPAQREKTVTFSEEDLVISASPTYAGRIPNKIMPFVQDNIVGNGALGVSVVTYGGRSFDDSLMEMYLLMQQNSFRVIGAAAALSRHTLSDTLCINRPSEKDLSEAENFGKHLAEKILANDPVVATLNIPGNNPVGPYYKPLDMDGNPAVFLKAKSKADISLCKKCGLCAKVCPMASISFEDPAQTPGICIKCHACVLKCPEKARYFDDPSMLSHVKMIETNFGGRDLPNKWYLN